MCPRRRGSNASRKLFGLLPVVWAWISHLPSLQNILRLSVLRPWLMHSFRNLSWHLAVYRPKYGFTFVVIVRLRCIDCQKLEVRTTGVGVQSEEIILSLVIQCYQKPDGFRLRLTWVFSSDFIQWSLRFEIAKRRTTPSPHATSPLVMRYAVLRTSTPS